MKIRKMPFVDEGRFSPFNAPIFEQEAERLVNVLEAEVVDAMARAERIRSDRDLSQAGQNKKISELFAEKKSFVDKLLFDHSEKYARQRDGVFKTFQAVLEQNRFSTGDRASDEVRAASIRQWFASLDPVHREATLTSALTSGDYELLDAIRSAPKCFQLAPESLHQELDRRRAAMLAPDEASLAADLGELDRVLKYNVAVATNELAPLADVARATFPEVHDPLWRQAFTSNEGGGDNEGSSIDSND